MKLASFEQASVIRHGLVEDDEVLVLGDGGWMGDWLAGAFAKPDLGSRATERLPLGSVRLLPPVVSPPRIFCIGVNYEEHRLETGRERVPAPIIFMRTSQSQVGHGTPIVLPDAGISTQIDYEGEIAIVIGKGGRNIAEADALAHVAAYSCYNDVSVRDWQRHTSQWIPGKNFDGLGAFGPWLVSADSVPAPVDMRITTRLNGEEVQNDTADGMIFSIPEQIAYLSKFTALLPGDVIATGTPGGVGVKRTPQLFMKAGDVVEVEISGIGLLSNRIA